MENYFTMKLPTEAPVGKKIIPINMNRFRNLHYRVKNLLKRSFEDVVIPNIPDEKYGKIELTYTLYIKTKRTKDIANVLAMQDKFFCDCLVKRGVIKDDSYTYIKKITLLFGGMTENEEKSYAIVEVKEII